MAESSFEKTEAPTPRRRQEARQDGSVARSTDLTAALVLLASIVLLHIFGLKLLGAMKTIVYVMLASPVGTGYAGAEDVRALIGGSAPMVLAAVAPVCLGIMSVALIATVGQVGLMLTPKPLQPKLSRLSLLKGAKGLFDARAGMRLAMSLLKIAVIALVAIITIYHDMPQVLLLCQLDPMPMFGGASELVYALALKLVAVLLILALLDYAFQRWQHERDLRMTKQEIKEELKRMEGDPMVKQRRARVARQLALQRIGQAVPQADVVVTNPTHFAVALRYDTDTMTAPKVVAKGADFMALRIRQLAMAHSVPLVERKALARALYSNVEVGQEIPPKFFNAVAEILAYVYRLSHRQTA